MSNVILYILLILIVLGVIFGGLGYGIWRFFKGKNSDKNKTDTGAFFSQKEAIAHLLFLATPGLLLAGIVRIADGEGSLAAVLGIISVVTIILAFSLRLGYGIVLGYLGIMLSWVRFVIETMENNSTTGLERGGGANYETSIAVLLVGTFLLFVFMYIIGRFFFVFESAKRVAYSCMVLGIFGSIGVMFWLVSEDVTDSIRFASFARLVDLNISIGALIILLGVSVFGGSVYGVFRQKSILPAEGIGVGVLTFLVIVWLLVETGSAPFAQALPTLIPNTVTLLTIIGILLLGGQRSEKWMINIAAFLLIIWMLVTYGAWSSTLLGSGTVFILGGLFLLLVGWGVEKGRRWAISSAEE